MNLLFIGLQELFVLIPLFGFFIYTIYHAVRNPVLIENERLIWILIILLANVLGTIAYWGFGKNGRNKLGT
ncbi:Phospholipase_D-nuclease N-terminal [Sphingobacterium nematocida]|uniref:Phospholipase_D-nuclease N-terminal n=1 Tax=Sphingobacterium nematocida TaxID=1513896 RepID=A0A1T5B224_9SPHI|nr:PLDc N-terminal domain-containing protein [Sphingobacterium nematocida]SKB41296.1 Phospholipase_D-nuclease N-terminal [Sphingobacterium nematocida]